MFPGEKEGTFEPFKYVERPTAQNGTSGEQKPPGEEDGPSYDLDRFSEDGAVWPIVEGKVVNWKCFYALMTHIHRSMSPHLHSPILLVAQPCWTPRDYEKITQFFFESFKPPGFVIVDSALCSLWAYNSINACVIDVGYEKADVSAITDFSVNVNGRGLAIPYGGEAITQKLYKLLKDQGFTYDMCEQLKRSPICEVLPLDTPLPGADIEEVPEQITNPAAAASTGALGSGPGQRISAGALGEAPIGPGPNTETDEGKDEIENDGVLDVASIVAGGNKKMEEFLARKEKEKQERAEKAAKKKGAEAALGTKTLKLRNIDKYRSSFSYEYRVSAPNGTNGSNGTTDDAIGSFATEDSNTHLLGSERPPFAKRDVEVGPERFQGADEVIDRIADAVYLAITSVDDVSKRSECWDTLILLGNGSKIRGKLFVCYETKLIIQRIQGISHGYNQQKIHHLSILGYNLYIRDSISYDHTNRHWCQHSHSTWTTAKSLCTQRC
jgi:actin-related protein 9